MKLQLGRIAEFLSAQGTFHAGACALGYSIDSRTVRQGELFFAVKGERFDGHDFVDAALQAGAVAAVVRRDHAARFSAHKNILAVTDTLTALQTLGAAVRRLWNHPLIAVTGSAGKTTTKDAIAHLLSAENRVRRSEGNLNNHFGLPLQLLSLEPEHEVAVMELGMSHAGEIAALARIARPDCGVVTCVAPVHLEFFESVADIARAKYELIESLPAGGIAVLNADDEYVSQFGRDFHGRVVTFGVRRPGDVMALEIEERGAEGTAFTLAVDGAKEAVQLPLLGRHNVYNALAAVAVSLQYRITPSQAAAALATLRPAEKRGEVFPLAGVTVIHDCYNSNPVALQAMVETLAGFAATRRIVVAGEMLELGPAAAELHRNAGASMARKADVVLGVRGLAEELASAVKEAGGTSHFVSSPQEAGDWLAANTRPGDAVLLKASRGVRLERALDAWRAGIGAETKG